MTKDAALVIPYRDYQVLLQLRDSNARNRPNKWAFFGGAIEDEELPIEACKRELFEELSLRNQDLYLIDTCVRKKKSGNFHKFIFVFPTKIPESYFKERLREGSDVRFFELNELYPLDMKAFDKTIAYKVFAYMNKKFVKSQLPNMDYSHELGWWANHLAKKSKFRDCLERLLEPTQRSKLFPRYLFEYISLQQQNKKQIKLLEVGAGPTSTLAWGVDKQLFEITAIDPLANEYINLMERFNYSYPIRPIKGYGEEMLSMFKPESFDVVYCRNALDHTMSAKRIFDNICYVTKKSGIIYLDHHIREGTYAKWVGLHQQDLQLQGSQLLCYNKDGNMINLTKGANVECLLCEKSGDAPGDWFTLVLKKK